jgi:hypothetical protein
MLFLFNLIGGDSSVHSRDDFIDSADDDDDDDDDMSTYGGHLVKLEMTFQNIHIIINLFFHLIFLDAHNICEK